MIAKKQTKCKNYVLSTAYKHCTNGFPKAFTPHDYFVKRDWLYALAGSTIASIDSAGFAVYDKSDNTMKRAIVLLFLFLYNVTTVFADKYNINNLFEIAIPEDMELVYVRQNLLVQNNAAQYYILTYLCVIYQNTYLEISIRCYGNTNESILNGTETLSMKTSTYTYSYNIADRIKFLKPNYSAAPVFNKNGVAIGRFVSMWGSLRTSDTYSLYFTLPDRDFNECSIVIDNIWGMFSKNEKLDMYDKNYERKIRNEGGELEKIFQKLAFLEDSITFTISNESHKIEAGYSYDKYPTDYSYILPTINNLRMRGNPDLTGEVLGFMENKLYEVIRIGEYVEIDGIGGNWLMIKPAIGHSFLSWVFGGYTRKVTEKEKTDYFEGS